MIMKIKKALMNNQGFSILDFSLVYTNQCAIKTITGNVTKVLKIKTKNNSIVLTGILLPKSSAPTSDI